MVIAKIDRKVLPYFSFPAARFFASMPKLKTARLNYYRKTEAPNADLYKLHQVKMLQNMLGTTTTNKKNRHAHFSGGCFHMASERFMCCNMHEEQTHRTVSVAVWGLCTLGMNYVDVFLLVW